MDVLDRESVARHMPVLEGFPHPDWQALDALVERFVERAWKQIRAGLDSAVEDGGHGKSVVMLFASQEAYYEYSAHFISTASTR